MSLRILVVTPSYPIPEAPGAAVFVRRQVEGLAAAGADCRVIVPLPRPRSVLRRWTRRSWVVPRLRAVLAPAIRSTVPVMRVPYDRGTAAAEDVIPAMREALLAAVRREGDGVGPDVVLAHWIWPGGAAALALRDALGVPVAAIARGGDLNEAEWFGRREDCRRRVVETLPRLDLPLANCRYLRERMTAIDAGAGRRARVVYNGCDAAYFDPTGWRDAARGTLGLESGNRLLAFCGEVTVRKGVPQLAEAFRALRRTDRRWRLVVVGGTTQEPATVDLLREAAGDALHLAGRVEPDGVRRILAAADLYAQPSLTEGLANATLEALAMGLPVVTTRCCGQGEAVIDGVTGRLVEPGDGPGLAEALLSLASDPAAAAALGRAGREHVLRRFDATRETGRLLRLLAALARRGTAGARGAAAP